MSSPKEFQVEYSIWLPEPHHSNFTLFGNPYDRENILTRIFYHFSQETGKVVDWSSTLGLNYKISESSRLLDNAWDNRHEGSATAEEMVALIKLNSTSNPYSKIDQMRDMHRNGDG